MFAGFLLLVSFTLVSQVGAYTANKCSAADVTSDATSHAASSFMRDTSYIYPYQTTTLAPTAQFPGNILDAVLVDVLAHSNVCIRVKLSTVSGLLLDYGPNGSFYASKTFYDGPNSQRLLWGWSKEAVRGPF